MCVCGICVKDGSFVKGFLYFVKDFIILSVCLNILHLECDHVSLVELKIEVSVTNCGRRRRQITMS